MFLTSTVRQAQRHSHVHYTPQHLSQWVKNICFDKSPEIFWGVCSRPDERGFVSLGPGSCYESEIRRVAKTTILEINPKLPVTFGDTHVHLSEVDYFIEGARDLPTLPRFDPSATDHQIAAQVARFVPDHATLQLGIGGIPNAVGIALQERTDLGIHTEMINDTMMDLYHQGVVTGQKKTLWPGKIVGSFVYGSKELYEFVDRNPVIELQPASIVNDPYIIGQNHKMISINTAVEVDITGQVCSESVGHQELSGVGGASETHVGAQRSESGRGIVAIPARTKKGESKITIALKQGAKVSISRNDVDTIVTEFGSAELRGKSVKERALALIAIAHPDDRSQLLKQAKEFCYI